MAAANLRTPVAMLIFNRPDTTARVFERVRAVRPSTLMVVADGPRADRPGEEERCREAREIVEAVDWPCELLTEYSDANLGCGRRISSGLDWVFERADSAIVLEDDCLPDLTFFRFCEDLLDRYRSDDCVMHISGDNFQSVGRGRLARLLDRLRPGGGPSYYFSRYPHVWGWASWSSAWRRYDFEMSAWTSADDKGPFLDRFTDPSERDFWRRTWDAVARGEIDTWDYQWAFACISRGGLSAMPSRNLVSNLGFGEGAHHTVGSSPLAGLPVGHLRFPLDHPGVVRRDEMADARTAGLFFGGESTP
jgi:hypothetical protein